RGAAAAGAAVRAREHAPSLGRLAAERERLDPAPKKRREDAAEPLFVQRAEDPSAGRDRDGLRLLRHHHDDRVGLRADRESRAVPHAVAVRAPVRVLFEWKKARRREDLAPADDHRSVVQRRARHEDRCEQLRGELAVHGDARLAVVLQPGRPLENDQRAVLGLTDEERGAHELVDDPLELLFASRREKPVEWPELTDLAERATQFGLEHDDERDEGYREEGLQKERREREVQRGCQEVDEHEDHDADEQLNGPCSASEEQHVIDENGNDEHVEHVVPAERLAAGEDVDEVADPLTDGIHQSARASASTSAARSLRPSRSRAWARSWHFVFATSRLPRVRTMSTRRRCASWSATPAAMSWRSRSDAASRCPFFT